MSLVRKYSVVPTNVDTETLECEALAYIEQNDGTYIARMVSLVNDDVGNKFVIVKKSQNKHIMYHGDSISLTETEEVIEQLVDREIIYRR